MQEPLYHYHMDKFLIKSPIIYKKYYKIIHIGGGPNRNHPLEINLNIIPMENVDIVGNAENLPFEDESVDVIISNAVLEHVDNLDKALSEMQRVLKPNGLVYVEIPFMQHYHTHDCYGVKFEDYRRFTKEGLQKAFAFCYPIDVGVCVGPTSALLQIMYSYFNSFGGTFFKKIIKYLYFGFGGILKNIDKYLSNKIINNTSIPSGIYFFGMKKGEATKKIAQLPAPNSIFPRQILSKISLKEKVGTKIVLLLKNCSNTTWIKSSPVEWGTVNIGVQILYSDGHVNKDYKRVAILNDIHPGEEIEQTINLANDDLKGTDKIILDLVSEGVCWFSDYKNIPLEIKL
ncbi:class I SAM-dependent methyltransferase [Pectinatus frisingensis]|uniref:class I SAM-dependent methyltransferase n=1 Tax=Pectinatus frisingensis TaxID=865 RepID=UPI0018C7BBD5|nr:class I SAM-dependent methyltransferase [Pectinatus frisingensis]